MIKKNELMMTYVFWVLWIGEMVVSVRYVAVAAKLKALTVSPFPFLVTAYLLGVLSLRYVPGGVGIAFYMVLTPVVPMATMILYDRKKRLFVDRC